jgi:hypothetical protein
MGAYSRYPAISEYRHYFDVCSIANVEQFSDLVLEAAGSNALI